MKRFDTLRLQRRGLISWALWTACLPAAQGQAADDERGERARLKLMHSFDGSDGRNPRSAPVVSRDGWIYGVVNFGGAREGGTAYRLSPRGRFEVLHHFADRRTPARPGGLIEATDGQFYGTSGGGGVHNDGSFYRMTPLGDVTMLHSFHYQVPPGAFPHGRLLQASDGQFYGVTGNTKGQATGGVYGLTAAGEIRTLHEFGHRRDNVSAVEDMPPVQASDGHLYGAGPIGGAHGGGALYRLTLDGHFELLHSFRPTGELGSSPGTLVLGRDGRLYGTTGRGGANGTGCFFRMNLSGHVTLLRPLPAPPDFSGRTGDLLLARDGHFYGVSNDGGVHNEGQMFRLTAEGDYTPLCSFGPAGVVTGAPRMPVSGVVEARDGEFYGATIRGGLHDLGAVYRVRPS